MMADHIPHTRDNQNQTTGGCFHEVVEVLVKCVWNNSVGSWSASPFLIFSLFESKNGPIKRTTLGFSDAKFFNNADHGLNERSESGVKGPQAIVMENDVSRCSCFNASLRKVDEMEGRRGGN